MQALLKMNKPDIAAQRRAHEAPLACEQPLNRVNAVNPVSLEGRHARHQIRSR